MSFQDVASPLKGTLVFKIKTFFFFLSLYNSNNSCLRTQNKLNRAVCTDNNGSINSGSEVKWEGEEGGITW